MNDLVAQQSNDLAPSIGQTDEISWTGTEDMTFEDYQRIGRTFQQIKNSLAWWVGDWLNFGDRKFGEAAMQAVEDTGKSMETLLKWKAVSFRVPRNIRRSDLGWTHHFYVAYVPEEQRGKLLDLAANIDLSSRELKDVVKLDDERRSDLLIAVQNYMEEQGPMSKDVFMRLLNDFKMLKLDKPKQDKDDDDDEPEDENGDDDPQNATQDDVQDFWENAGMPITLSGPYAAFWEGMSVRAAMNGQGKPHLVWEKTDDDE